MTRKIKLLLSCAFLAILISSCTVANKKKEYFASVEVSNVDINGVRIDSTKNEIYKVLGKPDKIINHGIDEVVGGNAVTIYYLGLKIYLINNEIFALECKGKICKTDKGIKIGDKRENIISAYGKPSDYEITGDRISYEFRDNKTYIDSSFIFYLKDNKVIKIIYHVDYT